MPPSTDLTPCLTFLAALRRHNDKAWFTTHQAEYEAARGAFAHFIDDVIEVFRGPDQLGGLTAKACLARIHRDVRFSKDKSPYKLNFGALIAPGGWKATAHGYYIAVQPGGQSMVAGGLYAPTPAQLHQFRLAVHNAPEALKAILRAKRFVDAFGTLEGERLKTAPKGFDRDHPELALLQLKQITVLHRFTDAEVQAPAFAKHVIAHCRAMRPFLDYLNAQVH